MCGVRTRPKSRMLPASLCHWWLDPICSTTVWETKGSFTGTPIDRGRCPYEPINWMCYLSSPMSKSSPNSNLPFLIPWDQSPDELNIPGALNPHSSEASLAFPVHSAPSTHTSEVTLAQPLLQLSQVCAQERQEENSEGSGFSPKPFTFSILARLKLPLREERPRPRTPTCVR